jgi:RNA polymerase sigma-70 factor, ECF subfamily
VNEVNDEELIEQFYDGDRGAFTMIFERHKPGVFNFALRMTGNRPDAEDVTSDTFMRVCDMEHRYLQENARFKTWLYTIARNLSIDRIRQKQRWAPFWFNKPESDDMQEMDVPDQTDGPSQILNQHEIVRHLQNAIAKLPVDQREALLLREYQGLSYEEIARILDCSLANVKILIYRARTQLKDSLPGFIREGR